MAVFGGGSMEVVREGSCIVEVGGVVEGVVEGGCGVVVDDDDDAGCFGFCGESL